MPETPCLFGNQTAVFLKYAEIDCALESAKKPRTAGLCGRAAGACDCGPLSCAFIERVNKGRKPPEQGMVRRKNTLPKGSFSHRRSRIHRSFSHIAHKRCNARFKGLWRVHTPPHPGTAHTAAHRAKHGAFRAGALSLPSDRFVWFGNPARPGVRTANFVAFTRWSAPCVLPRAAAPLLCPQHPSAADKTGQWKTGSAGSCRADFRFACARPA